MTNVVRNASVGMINVSVSFGDGYVKANGEAAVYIICYVQRKKIKFNTGVSIQPEAWDPVMNKIRGNSKDVRDANLLISNTVARINDIFVKYRLQDKELTPQLIRKEYRNPSIYTDFYSFMESAIDERKGELAPKSAEQHRAIMNKLKEFQGELNFSEIDEDMIKRFNRWMINTKKNGQNTRYNAFKILKAYLNIAMDKQIIRTNPLKKLPVLRAKTDPVWLTEPEVAELVLLYRKRSLPDTYHRVLRHFLFGCVTGLRISDVKRIRFEDIIGDRLVIIPQKSKNRNAKTVKIPLARFAWELIRDENGSRNRGIIFDMLSEGKTNQLLKDIMPAARINKNVTFHTSRHTFATYFLMRTKNIKALQDLLGHSRITETMIYSHILAEELDKEVDIAFGDIAY